MPIPNPHPPEFFHTKHDGSWWENDARGIPLARVCDKCRTYRLQGFRADVLTDSQYETDEPIEPEDY
jgi:hypothetical protein